MDLEQELEARMEGLIKRRIRVAGCLYCETEAQHGNTFHPPHDASDRCESGKHSHCSCDMCF